MELVDHILPILERAGARLVNEFGQPCTVSTKGTFRELSIAVERKCEEDILTALQLQYPDYGAVSEESSPDLRNLREFTWVLDPLDGTISYTRGLPGFTIAIALLREATPVFSMVYEPLSRDVYFAERGRGSFLNGTRLRVSNHQRIGEAVISVGHSMLRTPASISQLTELLQNCLRVRSNDGTALELCRVASGKLDAYINHRQRLYDVCAGALIVLEAGGCVLDSSGDSIQAYDIAMFENVLATTSSLRGVFTQHLLGAG